MRKTFWSWACTFPFVIWLSKKWVLPWRKVWTIDKKFLKLNLYFSLCCLIGEEISRTCGKRWIVIHERTVTRSYDFVKEMFSKFQDTQRKRGTGSSPDNKVNMKYKKCEDEQTHGIWSEQRRCRGSSTRKTYHQTAAIYKMTWVKELSLGEKGKFS